MPIQDTSIELIQQAGQTLHRARQALQGDVQASAQRITAAILQSAGKDLDSVFAGVKEVARLLHDLEALEGRLKDLYLNAVSVAGHRSPRTVPLGNAGAARAAEGVLPLVSEVQDVEPKAPRAAARARGAGRSKAGKKTPGKTVTAARTTPAKAPQTARPERLNNDQKLLAFFKSRLNSKGFTRVTGQEIREGAEMPAGSVSASLARLIRQGLLEHKGRGTYRWVRGKA